MMNKETGIVLMSIESNSECERLIIGLTESSKAESQHQENAVNLWRAVTQALCHIQGADFHDSERVKLSISTIVDYLSLPKIEELYIKGFDGLVFGGEWPRGLIGVKNYLDTCCTTYRVDKLLKKYGRGEDPVPAQDSMAFEQDSMVFEQHACCTSQIVSMLNSLNKKA